MTAKTAPKGTKTTETIVGAGAAKLAGAVKFIQESFETLKTFDQSIEERTLALANLEAQIAEKTQELENLKKNNQIAIDIAYRQDERKFVDQYLSNNNLTAVPTVVHEGMKIDLENAGNDKDAAVKAAVAAATATLKAETEAKVREVTLTHEKTTAQLQAADSLNKEKITFLTEQVESWKKALDAERAAGVERAKAGSIGTLNVQGSKN